MTSLKKVAFGEQYNYILFKIPTWILIDHKNADIVCDLEHQQRVNIADQSTDIVYSSHMIEHISDDALDHFISESYRILRKGGCLRIEAPDTEKLIKAYQDCDRDVLVDFLNNGISLSKKYNNDEYASLHTAFLTSLIFYIRDGEAIPVLVSKQELDEKLSDTDSFVEWCKTLLSEEQKATHGHINPVYYSKLESKLLKAGFSGVRPANNRETEQPRNIKESILQIERPQRAYYSFYVDAVK